MQTKKSTHRDTHRQSNDDSSFTRGVPNKKNTSKIKPSTQKKHIKKFGMVK